MVYARTFRLMRFQSDLATPSTAAELASETGTGRAPKVILSAQKGANARHP